VQIDAEALDQGSANLQRVRKRLARFFRNPNVSRETFVRFDVRQGRMIATVRTPDVSRETSVRFRSASQGAAAAGAL